MDIIKMCVVIANILALDQVHSLECFACFDTGGQNKCTQYNTYLSAVRGKGNPNVLKNCTAPYDQACIIETFAILGNEVSHIRDCSDNRRFSFTSNLQNNRSAYDRLYELQLNNETACVWDGQHQVCLSKCDTDFCNGPQINNGRVPCFTITLLFIIVLWLAI